MENFQALGLPQTLIHALNRMDFNTPTPIQAAAIPVALEGRDILGSAQTGTGKTAAFSIPMIAHLLNNPHSTALVLSPTRELATQIMQAVRHMIDNGDGTYAMRTALLIGGEDIGKQLRQLKNNPRLVIGTPGRINDHLKRKSLQLGRADFLVMDETDRMLDMGFGEQIETIVKLMPEARQTLLFSATLPPYALKLATKYLNNPERIAVGSVTNPIDRIEQKMLDVKSQEKFEVLSLECQEREGSIIVFVKTKHGADKLADRLSEEMQGVDVLHGGMKQGRRDRVVRMFKDQRTRVLIATDVAARGLDVPHINHVINFDAPQCPEDYVHRIGRTARAGANGFALCLVTPEDRKKWQAVKRFIGGDQDHIQQSGRAPAKGNGGNRGGDFRRDRDGAHGDDRGGFQRGGDKPWAKKRAFGDRPYGEKKFYGDRNDRPRSDWHPASNEQGGQQEQRPFKKKWDGQRNDRPRQDRPYQDRNEGGQAFDGQRFGADRPQHGDRDGNRAERPDNRDDNRGNRYERNERNERSYGDRPARSFDGPKKPFNGKKPFRKDDRQPRQEFQPVNMESAQYGDRPARSDKPFAKKPFVKKPYGDKPRFDGDKPRFEGDKPAWKKRDDNGNAKPFAKKPFAGKKPFAKKEGGPHAGKPFGKKPGGFSKPRHAA